jgi:hypothetical protein
MTSPDLLFRRLLKELRPSVTKEGFRRHSQNFVIESNECWGVINFQKSSHSSAHEKRFTVNVAIAAKRVVRFYGDPSDGPPLHWKCHWRNRIGSFIPGAGGDRWWPLSGEASYNPIFAEVETLLVEKAVPMIKSHLTEGQLLALWDENVGGFEYPMLKHKSILLAEQGAIDQLAPIFGRIREICRGSSASDGAEQHIALLKQRFRNTIQ